MKQTIMVILSAIFFTGIAFADQAQQINKLYTFYQKTLNQKIVKATVQQSSNPDYFIPLLGTTWEITYTIIEPITMQFIFNGEYEVNSSGVVGLKFTTDRNLNGLTLYELSDVIPGTPGFAASIYDSSAYDGDIFIFNVEGDALSGYYFKGLTPYQLSGYKIAQNLSTQPDPSDEITQEDLDAKYQEGYSNGEQAGIAKCQSDPTSCGIICNSDDNSGDISDVNDCKATYSFISGILHIPCFDAGESTYWFDMSIISNDPLQLELTNLGQNE